VDDNAFATPEYRAFLDGLQGWLLRAWRYGDWDIAAGQFFTNFSVAIHVVPARPIPPHWRLWMAIDYGWVHYTVVYLFGQDDDGNVFVLAEHAERRWLPDQHAAAIDAMLERLGVPPYRIETFLGGGDMFSPHQDGKTTADDYRACGYKLVQANTDRVNGAAEIVRRLGCTAATPAIGPRLFISEDCPRLIECLPALESSAIRPQDVQKVDCDPDGLGGDDPYDACRYGVMHAAAPSRRATFGADPFEAVRWGA
jgi:phage terminase large subunit